jgi:hypothetical protein
MMPLVQEEAARKAVQECTDRATAVGAVAATGQPSVPAQASVGLPAIHSRQTELDVGLQF